MSAVPSLATHASSPRWVPIAQANTDVAVGQRLRVHGWVHRTRSSGGICFLVLRDATGQVQVTAKKDVLGPETFSRVEKALVESALIVEGAVASDKRAPGGHELRAEKVEVVHAADNFPIFTGQTEDFLLDHRHLAIRTREMVATMKVKAEALRAARAFLDGEGYWEVTPPILSGNAAEGGAEAFELEYFGEKAYLAQTAQLYLEALIYPLEKVYAVTPSFRAEKSRTPRHLCEYTHLEAELGWAGMAENLEAQERLVAAILHRIAERRPEELSLLGRDPKELKAIEPPFERIRYAKALELLQGKGFDLPWGSDLATAEERALTLERTAPVFVTHFPKELKAFYMLEDPEDPRTVQGADLLAPEGYGEIIGGSCRETDITKTVARLEAMNVPRAPYEWYLDLRRFGSVPHAGFGMGIERIVRWVTRREHIRDTTPFPRTPSRLLP
ncbi:MAG: asparagine--tRNA ligase [Euryarchaeota archaeon]|nr:asparagine--tRNA ligase [Euryarchaeota archaeon]MDE1836999.1 asparagine--tRNA ligase [Euryarchaeota archaeon]MDE1881923.1 asparagine--tRNA ligase [Euryarchaeota archaeon]MDE2045657.1 asparagine--tRNA ligase [Thermoplasmata archaeon]